MIDPRLTTVAELAAELDDIEDRLRKAVHAARRGRTPVPWQLIADTLGLSRQGAYQRYTRPPETTVQRPRRAG